jgi:hypothetical protein
VQQHLADLLVGEAGALGGANVYRELVLAAQRGQHGDGYRAARAAIQALARPDAPHAISVMNRWKGSVNSVVLRGVAVQTCGRSAVGGFQSR